MEESLIPSLSGGVVGSRFVTQDEVETAKVRREEQWKAAYARFVIHFAAKLPSYTQNSLGQEPPPVQQEEVYDGRSLAEVSCLQPCRLCVLTSRCWFRKYRIETCCK